MRGVATVEEIRKDREALIISEIPYQVNKASMIEKIAELVRDKRIEGISDLRDESDREGMRVVVELKRWLPWHGRNSCLVFVVAASASRPQQLLQSERSLFGRAAGFDRCQTASPPV